jgi:hypothetical protein
MVQPCGFSWWGVANPTLVLVWVLRQTGHLSRGGLLWSWCVAASIVQAGWGAADTPSCDLA